MTIFCKQGFQEWIKIKNTSCVLESYFQNHCLFLLDIANFMLFVIEDTYHYFFDCPLHNEIRQQLMQNLSFLGNISIRDLLFGRNDLSWHKHHDIQTRTHIHPPQQTFLTLKLNTNLKTTNIQFKHVTQLLPILVSRSLSNITPLNHV